MSNKILFIAGGIWQKPFVNYLKKQGNFVIIVNPIETATTDICDYHIKVDVNDLDEINKHIQNLWPIVAITSDQSDISTMSVAQLSEQWHLPGNSVETMKRLTNKFEMYNFAKSQNIPVPTTSIVFNADDVKSFALNYGLPVIIKPVDATMSRGFRKFNTLEDITDDYFLASLMFSKQKQVIAQTFVEGKMVTLEGVCSGGRHKTIATSLKEGFFVPGINSGVKYPSSIDLDLVIADNDRYVEEAGMHFGLTHSEYIINDNGFSLIEIGGRGGGAGISDRIVPWASGVDVYDILYRSLLGEAIDVKQIEILNKPALLKYYQEHEMELCNEEKIKSILQIPGVAAFHYNFIGKQYVSDRYDKRHTMAIYLAETDYQLLKLVDNVNNIIQSQS